jgi:cobalt/nickel transport system ATP-binding protein
MRAADVHVRGLSYHHPDGTPALEDVSFTVGAGERLAVVGPNGAGKTTLALHLNGLLLADRGEVRIGELVVGRRTLRDARRRVGLVFQDPDDQLFMATVRADVAFGPANLGLDPAEVDERVVAALGAVSLADRAGRPPHHLSQGEKRRAALATVLAMEPDVIVLDEPTANLDPAGRRELITVLAALPATLVIVTHDLYLALELCPRTLLLDQGQVVADGPTAHLVADDALLQAHRLELPGPFPTSGRGRSAREP